MVWTYCRRALPIWMVSLVCPALKVPPVQPGEGSGELSPGIAGAPAAAAGGMPAVGIADMPAVLALVPAAAGAPAPPVPALEPAALGLLPPAPAAAGLLVPAALLAGVLPAVPLATLPAPPAADGCGV